MRQWERDGGVAPTPTVPPGLPELMEGLSKEVLKHNPTDIYAFCAEHMEKLLKIREASNKTPKPEFTLDGKILRTQGRVKAEKRNRHSKNISTIIAPEKETVENILEKNEGVVTYKTPRENINVVGQKIVEKADNIAENNHIRTEDIILEGIERLIQDKTEKEKKSLDKKKENFSEHKVVSDESKSLPKSKTDINESLAKESIGKENEHFVEHNIVNSSVLVKEKKPEGKESLAEPNTGERNEYLVKDEMQERSEKSVDAKTVEEIEGSLCAKTAGRSESSVDGKTTEESKHLVDAKNVERSTRSVDEKTDRESATSVAEKAVEVSASSVAQKAVERSANSVAEKAVEGSSSLADEKTDEESATSVAEKAVEGSASSVAQKAVERSANSVAEKAVEGSSSSADEKTDEESATSVDETTVEGSASSVNEKTVEGSASSVGEKNVEGSAISVGEKNVEGSASSVNEKTVEGSASSVGEKNVEGSASSVDQKAVGRSANSVEKAVDGSLSSVDKKTVVESSIDGKTTEESKHLVDANTVEGSARSVDENTVEGSASSLDEKTEEESGTLVDENTVEESPSSVDEKSVEGRALSVDKKTIEGSASSVDEKDVEGSSSSFDEKIVEIGVTSVAEKAVQRSASSVAQKAVERSANSFVEKTVESSASSVSEKAVEGSASSFDEKPVEGSVTLVAEKAVEGNASLVPENTVEASASSVDEKTVELSASSDAQKALERNENSVDTKTVERSEHFVKTVQGSESPVDIKNIEKSEHLVGVKTVKGNESPVDTKIENKSLVDANIIEIKEHPIEEKRMKGSESLVDITPVEGNESLIENKMQVEAAKNEIGINHNTKDKNSLHSLNQSIGNEKNEKQTNVLTGIDLHNTLTKESIVQNCSHVESSRDNEPLEKVGNIEDPIESKSINVDKSVNNDETIETSNDDTKTEVNDKHLKAKKFTPDELNTLSAGEKLNDRFEGNTLPNIVASEILQNNVELLILKHIEKDNNLDDSTIEIENNEAVKPTEYTALEPRDEKQSQKVEESGFENSLNKDDYKTIQTSYSMDLETAAITIQKVFRAFLFKSRASTSEENTNDGHSLDMASEESNKTFDSETDFPKMIREEILNDTRPPGVLTRANTVLQTVNEEKSLSLSTDESSTLSSAATVIQAHVRGFLVRNRLSSNKFTSSDTPATSDDAMDASRVPSGKTILKISIPEQEHFITDSIDTSVDLPTDPVPYVSNLHPLGYNKDARSRLKREDAIQSVTPPSNSSFKLSEETISQEPSVEQTEEKVTSVENNVAKIVEITTNTDKKVEPAVELKKNDSLTRMSSDEMDVVTPYSKENGEDSEPPSRLLHSSEFHDVLLPTRVARNDPTVARGE